MRKYFYLLASKAALCISPDKERAFDGLVEDLVHSVLKERKLGPIIHHANV